MLWKKDSNRSDALYIDLLERPLIDSIYDKYMRDCTIVKHTQASKFEKNEAVARDCRQNGNEEFAQKKWVDATEWYNKSMCFAEEGSESMGLAYANRSSCFFNMKMYRKCLDDIDQAKLNNYPQEKMSKLDQRVAICLDKMKKETDQSDVFEPELDYEPKKMYPCFANVLQIKNNTEHGRHIVANDDIDVGKTVMVDKNYVAETLNQKYKRCNICHRLAANLKPCNKCVFAMFCPRCEENSFHDIECQINPVFFGSLQFKSYRMVVVRSILLATNAFADIDQLMTAVEKMLLNKAVEVPESLSDPQSEYRAFFKLRSNVRDQMDQKLPQKIYRMLIGQPEVSQFFHSEAHRRFLMHLIGHHITTIQNPNLIRNDRSSTGQTGDYGEDIEIFLEHHLCISASYFNHSCAPNAYITLQNGMNTCVVIRPIRRGEQLCVTYDDKVLLALKEDRQELILSKFNFQCKCLRCERPELDIVCLIQNGLIKTDPNFVSMIEDDVDDADNIHCYQHILALKARTMGLLKKYEQAPWSTEILRAIYHLYGLALIETEHISGSIAFTGHPFNRQYD